MVLTGHTRNVTAAAMTAILMLLLSGGGFWLLAEALARPNDSAPLAAGSLRVLPTRIGDWTGQDLSLDPALVAATATDDHLYRTYQRHAGTATVCLYIAYGIQGRDLMPHRPEVCYPGAGWAIRASRRARLPLADGSPMECTLYEFARGGLLSQTMYVLNYFIVDGRYSPDVSLLRTKVWRGGGVRYMAQVQVTTTGGVSLDREAALQSIRQFAAESALPIRDLLPDATDRQDLARVADRTASSPAAAPGPSRSAPLQPASSLETTP